MGSRKRSALLVILLYLTAQFLAWIWFNPNFVSRRMFDQIQIGAHATDVENIFKVRPYDFPRAAYCGKEGPAGISRIAIDEVGRVPLLPLPMVMITTTIFCFDKNDKLVGMKTERWFDEL